MEGCHHHIRFFLGADHIDIGLDYIHNWLEVHSAPDFFPKPGLYIGVFIAQDGNAEAGLPDHGIKREIAAFAVRAHYVSGQERHALALEFSGYAVIHGVAGFNVVVAGHNRIVLHISHQT